MAAQYVHSNDHFQLLRDPDVEVLLALFEQLVQWEFGGTLMKQSIKKLTAYAQDRAPAHKSEEPKQVDGKEVLDSLRKLVDAKYRKFPVDDLMKFTEDMQVFAVDRHCGAVVHCGTGCTVGQGCTMGQPTLTQQVSDLFAFSSQAFRFLHQLPAFWFDASVLLFAGVFFFCCIFGLLFQIIVCSPIFGDPSDATAISFLQCWGLQCWMYKPPKYTP